MPCKVLAIVKSPSDAVAVGDSIIVIKSIKMEINVRAKVAGTFKTRWKAGDAVDESAILYTAE